MKSNTMVLEDVRAKGMRVLQRELGPHGMIQFIQFLTYGKGDYTKDRNKLIGNLTVDQIFSAIKGKGRR